MKRASLIGSLVAVGILWISAAPAFATTFCVPTYHPGCPNNGTNVEQGLIQVAVNSQGSDMEADEVLIAPGTVISPGSIDVNGTDPLTIRGSGPEQTVLTTSANTNIYLLNLFDRDVVMFDLTVEIPVSFPNDAGPGAGILINGDALSNVDIRSLNESSPGGGSSALVVAGSGGFDNGDIYSGPGGAIGDAIQTQSGGGNLFVEKVKIVGARSAYSVNQNLVATAKRVEIVDAGQTAFQASNGFLLIDNSIVRGSTSVTPVSANSFGASAGTVTANHVTAAYSGPGNIPATASNSAVASTGSPSLTVTNSIFRGYQTGFQRQGLGTGSADLTVSFSNITDVVSETGNGTLTRSDNIDENPLFVNEATNDFHLTASSPSVDAGDPASSPLLIDYDFFDRVVDGNGDGVAVRDHGAFEFRPPVDPPDPPDPDTTPPDTRIDSGPGKKKQLKKRRATFTFSSTEAGSAFECKLGKAAFAACSSPTVFKKLKRGKHTFSVRARDAAGNVDASPATKTFKVPKKKKRKR